MTNFSAKILNNATGALAAQQAVIANIGNNIANANTPGFARRVVELQTRTSSNVGISINIGNGVEVANIQRIADSFIETILQQATSTNGAAGVKDEFLKRLEGLFSVSGDSTTIGSALTGFFNSINDLTTNPSSIELRKNVMEQTTSLVDTIKNTYNSIADLQTEADNRLTSEIANVNSIASQIADLNVLVSQRETSGQTASDERDKRDVLVNKLADKIGFTTLNNPDGSINITFANGFPLVSGNTARALELTSAPSFAAGTLPPSLSGGILRYVVYDYDPGAGQAHLDLTQFLKDGGGAVGGLLEIRGTNATSNTTAFQADGILAEMGSRVEAVTRQLLTSVNQTYLGPDETPGGVHQASSRDLNGAAPSAVYGLFDWTAQSVAAKDVDGNGFPDDIDDPTLAVKNFSSILKTTFTDPRQFAAALDSDPTAGVVSFETGNGANAKALADLQLSTFTFDLGSFGSQSLTTTFGGTFDEAVTHVGNAKATASLDSSVAQANLVTAQGKHDEVSSVSLDEEFTNLVRFQKAYQASARMIKVADDLMTQIIQLI